MPDTTVLSFFNDALTVAPWLAALLFMWWQERQARVQAEQRYQEIAKVYDALLRELAFGKKIEALDHFPAN